MVRLLIIQSFVTIGKRLFECVNETNFLSLCILGALETTREVKPLLEAMRGEGGIHASL